MKIRAAWFLWAWLTGICLLCGSGSGQAQNAPPPASTPASPNSPSASLPPLDLAGGYVVPFRYDPPTLPFLIVQARVNGEGPYPFMVDTGVSTPLLISKDYVSALKLRGNGQRSLANGTVKTSGVGVKTLEVITTKPDDTLTFNLTEGAATAYVIDLAFIRDVYVGPPIAGVIGAPALAALTERIDFARHEITFYREAHAPLNLLSAAVLPLRNQNSRYFVEATAPDGTTTPLLVDTGALLTTLPLSFRSHLHPTATILDGHETVGSFTLGSRWLLPGLRLGTFAEPDIAATVAEEGDSVLGLDLLTRFVLYLDCRNQQLLLQRAPDYAARRRLLGWAGLRLNGDNIVDTLRPTSPAYKAGVQTGDRVLTLDGSPIAGISAYLKQKLLDGREGTTLTLTLERGAAPAQTIAIPRVREFDTPPTVLDGVTIHKTDKKSMEILDVAPSSVADKAGLRARDRIVKMNGIPTKTLTAFAMWEQVRVAAMTVQVIHAGEKRAQDLRLTLPAPSP